MVKESTTSNLSWGLTLLSAALIGSTLIAHGSVVDPPSRVYRVYQANPDNPSFALAQNAVDMDGTLSYYTWNELSRNIPAAVQAGLPEGFDYSPWVPDGQLASGGRVDPFSSEYPRTYAGVDQVSPDWPKKTVTAGSTMAVDFLATAVHEPSVWDVWMTTPDWDPNEPLTWAKMEFIGRPTPTLTGNHYYFDVDIPLDRSGHHVMWVAWQRDDSVGEVFFSTCDLEIERTFPLYPGTSEDLQLATGINGNLSSTPPNDVKWAAAGNTWNVNLSSPNQSFTGEQSLVVAKPLLAGENVDPLFGTMDVYLDPNVDSRILQSAALAAGGEQVDFYLPISVAGSSFIFQGATLTSTAANGRYATTDVHRLHVTL
jgi:predicted carbohydrate-binding protein with CBM5 and CBM33 domain